MGPRETYVASSAPMSGAETSQTTTLNGSVGVMRTKNGLGMTAVGMPRTSRVSTVPPIAASQKRRSSVARRRKSRSYVTWGTPSGGCRGDRAYHASRLVASKPPSVDVDSPHRPRLRHDRGRRPGPGERPHPRARGPDLRLLQLGLPARLPRGTRRPRREGPGRRGGTEARRRPARHRRGHAPLGRELLLLPGRHVPGDQGPARRRASRRRSGTGRTRHLRGGRDRRMTRSRRRLRATGIAAATFVLVLAAAWFVGRAPAGQSPLARLGTEDVHALAFVGDDPEHLLVGHHGGILESGDGGRSWQPLPTQADAMAMAPASDGSIVIAGHEVFTASRDGGVSWQDIPTDLPSLDIHGYARDPADPGRMWALLATGGLWESRDGGVRWEQVRSDNILFPVATTDDGRAQPYGPG